VTHSVSSADTEGGSESFGTNVADTIGENTSWSNAQGHSYTLSPILIPQVGMEADAPMFWTLDEQRFLAMRRVFLLKDREAYVLAGDMEKPVLIRTPDVNRSDISQVIIDLAVGWYQQESGLTLPFEQAVKRVQERDRAQSAFGTLADADADFAESQSEIAAVRVKR
jgi:hypothetical protein